MRLPMTLMRCFSDQKAKQERKGRSREEEHEGKRGQELALCFLGTLYNCSMTSFSLFWLVSVDCLCMMRYYC